MRTAIVLFTRDLRVHDNPALARACSEYDAVVPVFVVDNALATQAIGRSSARRTFLEESLVDLDESLAERGAWLHVASGETVATVVALARQTSAEAVICARDVSPYATRREAALAAAVPLRLVDSHFAVPAGEVAPAGNSHYQVFSAYHRAWEVLPLRAVAPTPDQVAVPDRKSTRLNSSHTDISRMPSSA